MKRLLLFASMTFIPFFSVKSQNYYVGIPVYDTVVQSFSSNIGTYDFKLDISPQLIDSMPTGVNLYFKLTSSAFGPGCLYCDAYGTMMPGDSFLLTNMNCEILFSNLCSFGGIYFNILAIGTPTMFADSFYCPSQWSNSWLNWVTEIISYFTPNGEPQCFVDSANILSIENNHDEYLSFYPNPARERLTIDLNGDNQIENIRIYDLLRHTSRVWTIFNKQASLDISEISRGINIIELYTTKSVYRQKFIKE